MKKKTTSRFLTVLILSVVLFSCGQKKTDSGANGDAVKTKKHEHVTINTPDDAIKELKNGNIRFVEGRLENTDYKEQIENTKADQHPHSVILSCLDSRVPPETIFDQGIGNIFVARVAGNLSDDNILGSLEYGAKVKECRLIVVMGHSKCGAVKGALDNAELGHLTQLVAQIKPAITGDKSNPDNMLDETSRKNVKLTIEKILKSSEVLAELVKEGKLKIVGAYYDIATGKVEFMD